MQDLGDGSLHKLLQCPPEVKRIISQREKSDKKVEPWPWQLINFDAIQSTSWIAM